MGKEMSEFKKYVHLAKDLKMVNARIISPPDIFFDILNPVQINATGMDPKYLKETYGDKLVFWGGGIDTQKVLAFGSPEEVRKQVLDNCRIFGENGGFVFNTVHNIQANMPVENLAAMLKALEEVNR